MSTTSAGRMRAARFNRKFFAERRMLLPATRNPLKAKNIGTGMYSENQNTEALADSICPLNCAVCQAMIAVAKNILRKSKPRPKPFCSSRAEPRVCIGAPPKPGGPLGLHLQYHRQDKR